MKVEEIVTTLYQPVSTLYQAWVSAMEEVTKNGPTDSPERILTFCLNLVSTLSQPLSQPTVKAINLWKKNKSTLSVLNVLQILSATAVSMKDLVKQAEQTNRTRFVNN